MPEKIALKIVVGLAYALFAAWLTTLMSLVHLQAGLITGVVFVGLPLVAWLVKHSNANA